MAIAKPVNKYDIMRQRAAQESTAATQEQDDAMKRRFAAMGGLQTGAYVKQQQLTAQKGEEQKQKAMEGINIQESAEDERKQQINEERAFQSGEAEKGRLFARGERESSQDYSKRLMEQSQKFQTGERESAQKYQMGETAKEREFRQALADKDMTFKNDMFVWQQSEAAKNYDLEVEKLGLEKDVAEFNKQMADSEANKTDYFDPNTWFSNKNPGAQALGSVANSIATGGGLWG